MDETKPRRAPRKTSPAGSAPKAKPKAPAKAAAPAAAKAPESRKAPAATASVASPPATVAVAGAATKPAQKPAQKPALDPELRARMVETAAYFRAERRGFTPGYEVEDWLAAEAEIESLVGGPASPARSSADSRRKDA